MPNNLGPGVSRSIDSRDSQFAGVIYQINRPPLDSELNLISLTDLENRSEEVRSRVASGWLFNESDPSTDFTTNRNYSNLLYFGRNQTGEVRNFNWAVVNGWLIPVTGTKTGAPPLAPNDSDSWNKILLNPPSTSTGGNRVEFAFLEVWLARIDVDPPSSIAPGKPQRGFIYRYGNVEGGFSYLPDNLVDPLIGYETTRRIQLQYRIRVVADINISQYPDGFDSTLVFAQGLLASPSAVSFQNMRNTLGDPGLWRSGTGDPSTFGTLDGYVYAIPLCGVFRRNASSFSDIGNLAGSFNRNSLALNRFGATQFTNTISLTADMSDIDTSFSLTSIAGTVLATMTSFSEAYFRINDEIIQITNVIQVTPILFTININRGQLQTTVRSHKLGTILNLYTVRPDGLFADQVTSTDILDLRHSVADKFDYDSILKTSLISLLKGKLRTAWKRYGSTNVAGPVVFYGDRITDSSVSVGGLTRLDAPDGNRRIFSDAAVMQRFCIQIGVPTNATTLLSPLQVAVAPFNIQVLWTSAPPIHTVGNRLSGGIYPSWWNGDQVSVQLAGFQAGMPGSDSDQVRFILPTEISDSVIIRFEGMTTDPNGGIPTVVTTPTASNPNLTTPVPSGNRILKSGQGLSVSIDGSGNLLISLQSGVIDAELQEFIDALQGNTGTSYVQSLVMHIEFAVLYGSGRGLSHKAEYIHTAHYLGSPTNTSKVILRDGLSDRSRMIPTYLGDSPYLQTGSNRTYAKTSDIMVDPSSKTAMVSPYRELQIPSLLCRDGSTLNWYGAGPYTYQGAMPTKTQDGVTTIYTIVDPLDLFYNGVETRYVEVEMEYLPRPGLHHVPLLPVSNSIFSSGLNFLLMSKQGPNSNTSDWNQYLVSYPNAAGYYIVTPLVGEVYGTSSGTLSMFGQKYSNDALQSASGGIFRGIKFPPFLAPARITGVYKRSGSSVLPTSSPFDSNRIFIGGVGTDTNLLHDNFDGPTFLLEVNDQGDIVFILNADAIDLTKSTTGTTFDNSEFLIECTLFAYDRGFLQTNGRLLVAKASAGGSLPITINQFSATSDSKIGVIAPAPLSFNATNNEVTIWYSRTPYQGDIFGSQSSYSDDSYRRGPLTIGEATSLKTNPIGPVSTLSFPNKNGFEILAATSFATSLGTGRMSGPVPIPLLNTTEAPDNPPDYSGTIVDLYRKFSPNRVGFDDWVTPKFPVLDSSVLTRPETVIDGLSEIYDNDLHPEFAGCITNLPIGAFFRDKDFLGKTMYQARSTGGIGSISLGTLSLVPYEASASTPAEGRSTWEGTEFVCGNVSGTAGSGTESIVRVDGTANVNDVTIFKTTRGGAAWSTTGPWPGGVISSKFPKARFNTEVGSVLACTAFLVRSAPETIGAAEVHAGYELQLMLVTQAIPSYFRDTDVVHSANGTNEGYTAVDRFRVIGRPLEKRRGKIDTSILPTGKPLFVNKIFDNPIFFGSSDIPLVTPVQESFTVSTNGQVVFTLSKRPLDRTAVEMFVRGIKQIYGSSFTIGGITDQDVTYIPTSGPSGPSPALLVGDTVDFCYLAY